MRASSSPFKESSLSCGGLRQPVRLNVDKAQGPENFEIHLWCDEHTSRGKFLTSDPQHHICETEEPYRGGASSTGLGARRSGLGPACLCTGCVAPKLLQPRYASVSSTKNEDNNSVDPKGCEDFGSYYV